MYNLMVTLTDEQRQRAEAKARELGYADSDSYLLAVIDDALEDEITTEEILTAIKDGIREAQRGEGMSVEEFRRRMAQDD
ncbi:MAG: hypothetical protein SF123_02975 [Chloroflexota bacterium]|nr:hypothetical protein [Chloroflexota bacterium]